MKSSHVNHHSDIDGDGEEVNKFKAAESVEQFSDAVKKIEYKYSRIYGEYYKTGMRLKTKRRRKRNKMARASRRKNRI